MSGQLCARESDADLLTLSSQFTNNCVREIAVLDPHLWLTIENATFLCPSSLRFNIYENG